MKRNLAFCTQLAQNTPALLERSKDLDPPPPRELIETAEDQLERAELYLVLCQKSAGPKRE